MRRQIAIAAVLGVLAGSGAAMAEDLAAVEKKIIAAWGKHKTFKAKINMVQHVEMGAMVMDSKGDGTYEVMRQGDKTLVRMEMLNKMTQKMGEQENKMEQPITLVVDGEFAYTLTEMMGQKMATKGKAEDDMSGNPERMFKKLREQNELKLMPDAEVNGKKAYVIQATMKEKGPSPMSPSGSKLYVDQEHGVVAKIEGLGADGKVVSTITYSDFEFDVKIDPSRFKFEAPEGVQVIDQTGG